VRGSDAIIRIVSGRGDCNSETSPIYLSRKKRDVDAEDEGRGPFWMKLIPRQKIRIVLLL
jgi:hypothetical protein